MEHAMLVFEEAQDREQARTLERRHAEILGLEREGEPHPRVLEEAAQLPVDRREGLKLGQRRQHGAGGQGAAGVESLLQHRFEQLQLGAPVREETVHVLRIARCDLGDLAGELLYVWSREQFAVALEDEPILRIQPFQLDMVLQPFAAGREYLIQDLGIEEEGRPDVEAVAVRRGEGLRPTTDDLVALEEHDLDAFSRQQQGRGEASGPGADDDHGFGTRRSTKRPEFTGRCYVSQSAPSPHNFLRGVASRLFSTAATQASTRSMTEASSWINAHRASAIGKASSRYRFMTLISSHLAPVGKP